VINLNGDDGNEKGETERGPNAIFGWTENQAKTYFDSKIPMRTNRVTPVELYKSDNY
jgi:hypothetical protein